MAMQADRAVAAVKQRIDHYLELSGCVRKQHDPDTIHDFRVASRHLLAIQPLLMDAPSPDWRKKVKRRLKRLNRLRDLQVLRERLGGDDETVAGMLDGFIADELEQWKAASRKVAPWRFRRRLKKVRNHGVRMIEASPQQFAAAVDAHWQANRQTLLQRLEEAESGRPATLHKLRIAYKAFRYLATFLHDIGMLPSLDQAELKRWQDLLGDIQDFAVAAAWLREQQPEARQLIRSVDRQSATARQRFDEERPLFQQFLARTFERRLNSGS